jgi:lysyl-tRNA synthetase class 2
MNRPFDLSAARFRAESLHKIREFFRARGVLEVETPILSRGISLDCHIDVFSADYHRGGYAEAAASRGPDGAETFFLQTSPEPHMKRLLCAGFPDIWQLTKAFRNGESGRVHNPEFSMLEWYRRGYPLEKLMDEVEAVCVLLAGPRPVIRKTHREVFSEALGVDPLVVSAEDIARLPAVAARLPQGHVFSTKPDALDFAMAHVVEPGFDPEVFTFVYGFPSEQAAQAQTWADDPRVAHRFEVYGAYSVTGVTGSAGAAGSGIMELGNGYLELLDPVEYARRFDQENVKRRMVGKPELPKDPLLLEALQAGLPPCAGVAMGFDRLVAMGLKSGDIASVLSFPWDIC